MKNYRIKISVSDVFLLLLSVIFLIGILTYLKPCGPKDDGSWMSCHWAGNAVTGLAAVLTSLSLIHIFMPNTKIKMGLSLSMIPISIFAILIPGNIISTCMLDTMRCNAVMKPFAVLMSVLMIVSAVFDFIYYRKKA